MKKFLIIILFTLGFHNSPNVLAQEKYLILDNINIVDVINGGLIEKQTVVIKDSRIEFIGKSWKNPTYSKIRKIDGTNKYLIPGLWDMHFHISWNKTNDSLLFPVLFSKGITGIRDMGGDLRIQNNFKFKNKVRPEIYGAGPIIDGNPPVMYDFTIPVDKNSNIQGILDSIRDLGADFIKTYSLIKRSELEKVADYSKKNHINFSGHLSEFIDPIVSINLGQKSIEHLNRLDRIWAKDPSEIDNIAQAMIKNDTWLCPTLIIYNKKAKLNTNSVFNKKYDKYIPSLLAKEWKKSKAVANTKNDSLDWQKKEEEFKQNSRLVYFLHRKGIKILAGSDFAGMPYVYPGIGLLEELKFLGEAGLPNLEVIRTATINPAKYFSIDKDFGSVTIGKYADLVVLNKNPLTDIENIESTELVIKKGEIVYHPTVNNG